MDFFSRERWNNIVRSARWISRKFSEVLFPIWELGFLLPRWVLCFTHNIRLGSLGVAVKVVTLDAFRLFSNDQCSLCRAAPWGTTVSLRINIGAETFLLRHGLSKMEDPSLEVTHDILDCLGPGFGPSVKMFSCALCSEKFSNKKKVSRLEFRRITSKPRNLFKITIHWAVNHGYSLCSLCSVSRIINILE